MKPTWEQKMILTLMVWCAALSLWNAFQAYQIQDLLGMFNELLRR